MGRSIYHYKRGIDYNFIIDFKTRQKAACSLDDMISGTITQMN